MTNLKNILLLSLAITFFSIGHVFAVTTETAYLASVLLTPAQKENSIRAQAVQSRHKIYTNSIHENNRLLTLDELTLANMPKIFNRSLKTSSSETPKHWQICFHNIKIAQKSLIRPLTQKQQKYFMESRQKFKKTPNY